MGDRRGSGMDLHDLARRMTAAALMAVDPERLAREELARRGDRFGAALALGKAAAALARGAREALETPAAAPADPPSYPTSPVRPPRSWLGAEDGRPSPPRPPERWPRANGLERWLARNPVAAPPGPDLRRRLGLRRASRAGAHPGRPRRHPTRPARLGPPHPDRQRRPQAPLPTEGGGALRALQAPRADDFPASSSCSSPTCRGTTLPPSPPVLSRPIPRRSPTPWPPSRDCPCRRASAATSPPEHGERSLRPLKPGDPFLERVETVLLGERPDRHGRRRGRGAQPWAQHRRRRPPGEAARAGRDLVGPGPGTGDQGRPWCWAARPPSRCPARPAAAAATRSSPSQRPGSLQEARTSSSSPWRPTARTAPPAAPEPRSTARPGKPIRRAGIDPKPALARHDSRTALAAVPGTLLETGPTGTNAGDLAVYLRRCPPRSLRTSGAQPLALHLG